LGATSHDASARLKATVEYEVRYLVVNLPFRHPKALSYLAVG